MQECLKLILKILLKADIEDATTQRGILLEASDTYVFSMSAT